jgi:hypothetical protein
MISNHTTDSSHWLPVLEVRARRSRAGRARDSESRLRARFRAAQLRLAGEDVQALGGFAAGGERAAVIPLDVDQAGLLNDSEDGGAVV